MRDFIIQWFIWYLIPAYLCSVIVTNNLVKTIAAKMPPDTKTKKELSNDERTAFQFQIFTIILFWPIYAGIAIHEELFS
jgi:hypothetical protein